MYGVVALGLVAALAGNPTAAMLVIAWLAGEVLALITGDDLNLSSYFMTDVAVIALIYAKTIRHVGMKIYPSMRQQLWCMVMDLTVWDRWIVGLYLLGAWPVYVLEMHSYYKWWLLYAVVILQFLFASAEAAQSFVAHLRTRASSDPPGNGLALAGAYRRDG